MRTAIWLLLPYLASAFRAETLTGRVVKVADGDIMTILGRAQEQHRIRLEGIYACERKQPYANRSKQKLARLVAGKPVQDHYDK